MRFAALGRTETLYQSILEMESSGHNVELIVTCEPADFYSRKIEDFRSLADDYNSDFIAISNINSSDIVSSIRERGLPLAISVNWKTIIKKPLLNSFDHGIINFHAGDLPRYRGNAAMNWALLEGEDSVVYTLHLMSKKLDSGPILLQRQFSVTENTNLRELYDFAEKNVPDMFVNATEGLNNGTIEPEPQPESPSKALRCYPRIPKDSEIDWSETAEQLDRLVRASSEPLFGAYTYLDGKKLIIWRAHSESPSMSYLGTPGQIAERRPNTGEVAVVTGNDFLVLEEVETESHGRCEATEVITSHRTRLGMDVNGQIQNIKNKIESLEKQINNRSS
jgi:methionyl-tRNA formyltransferase